jgi:DNA-binding NarL/FixJ family response regulator
MARVCCLVSIEPGDAARLAAALETAGEPVSTVMTHLDVAELGRLAPDVLVADLDALKIDALETVRRLRFVLSECVLVVLTSVATIAWGRACHLAGANCLLSKDSSESELSSGLRRAIHGGCYTDPRFAA